MVSYLFLLLILACPLMMIFMMRGMHGGHGGKAEGDMPGHTAEGHGRGDTNDSLEELRRQREQIDREIEQRKADEETPTRFSGGWR